MFDRRNLTSGGVGAPIYKFVGHTAAVLCVQVVMCFVVFYCSALKFSTFFFEEVHLV